MYTKDDFVGKVLSCTQCRKDFIQFLDYSDSDYGLCLFCTKKAREAELMQLSTKELLIKILMHLEK